MQLFYKIEETEKDSKLIYSIINKRALPNSPISIWNHSYGGEINSFL